MLTTRRRFIQASMAVTASAAGAAAATAQTSRAGGPSGGALPEFRDLFNGRDLTGWVVPAGAEKTWSVRDGVLVCSGRPNGVMKTDRHYENFLLQIDWMHIEPGGNSGLYVWTGAEAQVERDRDSDPRPRLGDAADQRGDPAAADCVRARRVHRGRRQLSSSRTIPAARAACRSRTARKGRGEWNTYTVAAVDGAVKLAVNGKFVNGISQAAQKKGYLGLQSEGAEIHFRNIRIMELLPGVTTPEQVGSTFPHVGLVERQLLVSNP